VGTGVHEGNGMYLIIVRVPEKKKINSMDTKPTGPPLPSAPKNCEGECCVPSNRGPKKQAKHPDKEPRGKSSEKRIHQTSNRKKPEQGGSFQGHPQIRWGKNTGPGGNGVSPKTTRRGENKPCGGRKITLAPKKNSVPKKTSWRPYNSEQTGGDQAEKKKTRTEEMSPGRGRGQQRTWNRRET